MMIVNNSSLFQIIENERCVVLSHHADVGAYESMLPFPRRRCRAPLGALCVDLSVSCDLCLTFISRFSPQGRSMLTFE